MTTSTLTDLRVCSKDQSNETKQENCFRVAKNVIWMPLTCEIVLRKWRKCWFFRKYFLQFCRYEVFIRFRFYLKIIIIVVFALFYGDVLKNISCYYENRFRFLLFKFQDISKKQKGKLRRHLNELSLRTSIITIWGKCIGMWQMFWSKEQKYL